MFQKVKNLVFKSFKHPTLVFRILICKLRSYYFSQFIDEGKGSIIITNPFLRVKIKKGKGARLIINGNFRITPHIGGSAPVRIFLGQDSLFKVDGDFVIGQGVRISLSKNSTLYFGGKRKESDSGITSDTLIMVAKKIEIGTDFLCAWNVFISDSDWHQILDQSYQKDIVIGNHVWIANNCSILKGSQIGNNSIIASHSKVINSIFQPDSMLAGTPAKMVKSGISWSRDMNPAQNS